MYLQWHALYPSSVNPFVSQPLVSFLVAVSVLHFLSMLDRCSPDPSLPGENLPHLSHGGIFLLVPCVCWGEFKGLGAGVVLRGRDCYLESLGLRDPPLVVVVVQLLSHVWCTPGSLSFTISQNLLKLMSIESMMPSNHLSLCRPLLLLPSIFPSIKFFFQWVSSVLVPKVLELQHHFFQCIFMVDFL